MTSKLQVQVTADRSQIAIVTTTENGGTKEERTFFLDPAQSVEFANLMLKCAEECGVEVRMETTGISDEKRIRLIHRTAHVIRSLGLRKPLYTAAHVVDTILAEVM